RKHAWNGRTREKASELVRNRATWVRKDQQGDATHQKHGGERHHDRLEPHKRDKEAVERADRRADREAGENDAHLRCGRVLRRRGDERVHQRDNCARRKVEAANQDDECLSDGREGKRSAAAEDRIDVVVAERDRRDEVYERQQARERHDDRDQPPILGQCDSKVRLPGRIQSYRAHDGMLSACAGALSPRAARISTSSSSWAAGISRTMRPPYITSTRWQRFTSSGISVENSRTEPPASAN